MTALEKWKNDFKEFISELSIPRDDYKGIMEYINEVPNEALEQKPCEDLINQRATTCRHGGHCEWVACDKCNHYEQEPCTDAISREDALQALCKAVHKNDDAIPCLNQRVSCLWDKTKVQDYAEEILKLPSVTPKEKTGYWIITDDCEQFIAKCSKCGRIEDSRMISKYPYCHCGAKIVEPQESEDKE